MPTPSYPVSEKDELWMQAALNQAQSAADQDEVPVGAVIVVEDKLIATGFNMPIGGCDPTAHAEIVAIRHAAQRQNNYRLKGATLYVTLEPCAMCVGAMIQARIQRLVFGAYDLRAGAICSVFQILDAQQINHRFPWCGGILATESAEILRTFFKQRRVKP